MTQINERIKYLENAINVLTTWKAQTHEQELNRLINLAEYKEELESLKIIRKSNHELFR